MRRRSLLPLAAAPLALLAGCAGFAPDKPQRPTLYDFGPLADAPAAAPAGPPLVLGEVEANAALDGTAMLYRLGYADARQLRPYALARWSAPPGQLLGQRLRHALGQVRPVLDPGQATGLARASAAGLRLLRVELEEFSHHFTSPQASQGVVRVRCTLLENTAAGDRLLAQRGFAAEHAAASPDAPGGAQALAAASQALAQAVAAWIRAQP